MAGIPTYLLPRFNPVKVLDAIEARRATMFVGVPAMYRMLDEAGADERDLTSVRVWASGADAMPPELAERFKQMGATVTVPLLGAVGEAAFAEGYGMVEVGGGVAAKVSPPFLGAGRVRSARRSASPCPATRCAWSTTTGAERRRRPGRRAAGEGARRAQGLLGRRGRDRRRAHRRRLAPHRRPRPQGPARAWWCSRAGSKHVIKHGGYSVYALEVEQALEQHPDVLEAGVVGLPDERLGEVPGGGRAAAGGRHPRRGRPGRVGRRAAGRLQGARSASSPSTSCPAPAPTRSRRPSCVALFD